MKALITGVCGFSGRYLADYLLKKKVSVYGIDIKSGLPSQWAHLKSHIKLYNASLLDKNRINFLIRKIRPNYIFHLAGLLKGNDFKELFRVNVLGTRNVLDAALKVKAKVLISGSAAEYGFVSRKDLPIKETTPHRPVNYYGLSKLIQTTMGYRYFISQRADVYLTRVFNMTGPGEPDTMVCSALVQQIRKINEQKVKPIIYTGNLSPQRDFIDVRDVVRAYWLVINKGKPGEIYNVCSGRAYSIKEVLAKLIKISGIKKIIIKQSPDKIKTVDIPIQIGNYRKIRKDTGWKPEISFKQTLKDILK